MELWEIGAALLGAAVASVGFAGMLWWYLFRGVPGRKQIERTLREAYGW